MTADRTAELQEATTWEERMSQRAKARQIAREEAEREGIRQQYAHLAATLPPLPGEKRIDLDTIEQEHAGHLEHWCDQQECGMCSCGAAITVICIVPSAEPSPPCEICKARRIGQFAHREMPPAETQH